MLKPHESADDTMALMAALGRRARAAARPLAVASTATKNTALTAMADAILLNEAAILAAKAIDLNNGEEAGLSASVMDRLKLTPERIAAIAQGIREIAALADPVGTVIAAWDRPNGLHIERV
ncbi:MAG: glutamate-5-semialdehyde dehydrogenase, partial [Mesorhizobium sp.]